MGWEGWGRVAGRVWGRGPAAVAAGRRGALPRPGPRTQTRPFLTPTHTQTTRPLSSIYDVESKYYADGEDAYDMRKALVPGGAPVKRGRRGASAGGERAAGGGAEGAVGEGTKTKEAAGLKAEPVVA